MSVQNYKKAEKGFWTDIGSAVVNPNGTIDLTFDAFPIGPESPARSAIRNRRTSARPSPPRPAHANRSWQSSPRRATGGRRRESHRYAHIELRDFPE